MHESELKEVLRLHALWLEAKTEGRRAELSGVNLSCANLANANLSGANLSGANLYGANLYGANLFRANLSGVNLSGINLFRAKLVGANMSGANLSGANLSGADLFRCNLSGADLSGADLFSCNLMCADLSGADLSGVILSGANLSGADLSGAVNSSLSLMQTSIVPETGSFEGWKKLQKGYIAQLRIPAKAFRSSGTGRKCRASSAKVIAIYDKSGKKVTGPCESTYDSSFKYEVGKTVSVKDFGMNRFEECAPGIHFFLSRIEAENYGNHR